MNIKKAMILIGSIVLGVSALVAGAWIVTAPPDNVEPWKEKKCNEYVEQLELLNRYKLFWSFVQRRGAFNDCLKKVDEASSKP
jgi:hypothetical protein